LFQLPEEELSHQSFNGTAAARFALKFPTEASTDSRGAQYLAALLVADGMLREAAITRGQALAIGTRRRARRSDVRCRARAQPRRRS
jgi:hypothetical protein